MNNRYTTLAMLLLATAFLKAAEADTPRSLADQSVIDRFRAQGATFAIKKGSVDTEGNALYVFCKHPTDFLSIQTVISTLAERAKERAENLG